MSIISSIIDFLRIVVTGYIAYKEPTDTNTNNFIGSINIILSDENSHIPSESHNTIYSLDEKHDILSTDEDNDDVICMICTENRRNVVLIPCAHSVTCIKCIKSIVSTNNKCPVCRSDIKDKIFYFSS